MGVLFVGLTLGCTDNQENNAAPETVSDVNRESQNQELNDVEMESQIQELNSELKELKKENDILKKRLDRIEVFIPSHVVPSEKDLIPEIPFKIHVKPQSAWETGWTYEFEGTGQKGELPIKGTVVIKSGASKDYAQYTIIHENNTIIIGSDKHDYFDLVLHDNNYLRTLSKGWTESVWDYNMEISEYDHLSQKYKFN